VRRFSLAFLAILVAALAASSSGAAASVTIGQTGSDPFTGCLGVNTYDLVQPTVTTSTSYVAPTTGVITAWSHSARDEATKQQVTMKVWRLVSGNTYTAVGHDGPRTLTVGVVNTFGGIGVPVQQGDVLGLNVSAGAYTACFFPASGESVLQSTGNTADGEEATFGSVPGSRANISAVVEPDADRDGFGDETQDRCPTNASTQGTCSTSPSPTPPRPLADTDPPETTITKGAPSKIEKTTVTFKFRSDEAGSTFDCRLDKKPWRSCASPRKVKRLAHGKHKFKVRAEDAAGNTDPSPAVDKFKVVR